MADETATVDRALSDEELALLDAWWWAANYVCVGQIYLLDDPLLRRPLEREDIFAYHGYRWLIHRLTNRRTNHENLHVRSYKEEGTTRRRSTW